MILEKMTYDLPLADGWVVDSVIFGGRHDSHDERVLLATSAEGYQVVRVYPDGTERGFYDGPDNKVATELYLHQARRMVETAQGLDEPGPTTG